MTERQRTILDSFITLVLFVLAAWGFWSFFQGDVVYNLFSNNSDQFRDYLQNSGKVWAPVVYVGLIMLEVLIAFIPGWFIYPVGGVLFGFWYTVFLVMLANMVAGALSFWIGQRYGTMLLQKFIAQKHITTFNDYMSRRGAWALFILKINPVTSLDIWNYVAGASPMKFWKFMLANFLALLPLVMVAAALGEEVYQAAPQLLGVFAVIAVIYIIWFLVNIPRKIQQNRRNKRESIDRN